MKIDGLPPGTDVVHNQHDHTLSFTVRGKNNSSTSFHAKAIKPKDGKTYRQVTVEGDSEHVYYLSKKEFKLLGAERSQKKLHLTQTSANFSKDPPSKPKLRQRTRTISELVRSFFQPILTGRKKKRPIKDTSEQTPNPLEQRQRTQTMTRLAKSFTQAKPTQPQKQPTGPLSKRANKQLEADIKKWNATIDEANKKGGFTQKELENFEDEFIEQHWDGESTPTDEVATLAWRAELSRGRQPVGLSEDTKEHALVGKNIKSQLEVKLGQLKDQKAGSLKGDKALQGFINTQKLKLTLVDKEKVPELYEEIEQMLGQLDGLVNPPN